MSEGKVRLYVKGVVMGYKRGLRNQYASTSLIKMEHVKDKDAAKFYSSASRRLQGAHAEEGFQIPRDLGARDAAARQLGHGAREFRRNLPPQAIAGPVRVMYAVPSVVRAVR